jgi:thiopurine S-methyltransferase
LDICLYSLFFFPDERSIDRRLLERVDPTTYLRILHQSKSLFHNTKYNQIHRFLIFFLILMMLLRHYHYPTNMIRNHCPPTYPSLVWIPLSKNQFQPQRQLQYHTKIPLLSPQCYHHHHYRCHQHHHDDRVSMSFGWSRFRHDSPGRTRGIQGITNQVAPHQLFSSSTSCRSSSLLFVSSNHCHSLRKTSIPITTATATTTSPTTTTTTATATTTTSTTCRPYASSSSATATEASSKSLRTMIQHHYRTLSDRMKRMIRIMMTSTVITATIFSTNFDENVTYMDSSSPTICPNPKKKETDDNNDNEESVAVKEKKHDDDVNHNDNHDDNVAFRRLDVWNQKWRTGNTKWHNEHVHPTIVTYYDFLFPSKEGIKEQTKYVLIPLCGKTVDMAYIANHPNNNHNNYVVVGIDVAKDAIQQFIQEHEELNIQVHPPSSFDQPPQLSQSLYTFDQYIGNNIQLLCGDYFQFHDINIVQKYKLEHQCDVIWDRGSLVAIHPSLRSQYIQILSHFISYNHGKYILSAYVRDTNQPDQVPPYHLTPHEIYELFGTLPWVKSITILDNKPFSYDCQTWYGTLQNWYRFGYNARAITYCIETQQP